MRPRRPLFCLRGFVKSKTKVFEFTRSVDVRLCGIDLESEDTLYPFGDRVHHTFGTCFAAHCYNAVVCIADIAQIPSDEFLIKLVEHHIDQQG